MKTTLLYRFVHDLEPLFTYYMHNSATKFEKDMNSPFSHRELSDTGPETCCALMIYMKVVILSTIFDISINMRDSIDILRYVLHCSHP